MRETFIKNVAKLITGTAGSQVITVLLTPLITRMYGPEAFGEMGTFMVMVAIIIPLSALTYPVAIVLPSKEEEAKNLAVLSILIAFTFSIIFLIVIQLWGKELMTLINVKTSHYVLYLIPLVVILSAFYQVFTNWFLRKKAFNDIAKIGVLHSLVVNFAKVGTGLIYPTSFSLILISSISEGLHAFFFFLS